MINWRKPIITGLLLITGSHIPRNLKEIRRISGMASRDIGNYQKKRLKILLFHAWRNSPYYHQILEKCGAVSNGNVNLNKFDRIPFLSKNLLRNEERRILSRRKFKGLYVNHTGGSTGQPVKFWQDKEYDEWNKASKIYQKEISGQSIGEKELRFWGSERDLMVGKESFKMRLINWLYNRKELNTFRMSEKDMFNYLAKWNKFKPTWVEAYPQPMYEFARFIQKNKLDVESPKNGILTSAGNLYPEMKKVISEVFKCRVYNRYGSRELGDVAFGENQLKLSFWNQYLEVIGKKIYITNLRNFSMPFIRYEIGDMAERGQNDYEIKKILGRDMNMFRTASGKLVPGEFFIHFIGVVYNDGGIKKFQVRQKKYNYLQIITVIDNRRNFDLNRKKIEDAIIKEMGNDCKIEWKFVKDIRPTQSGKYMYTICEIM